MRKIVVLLAAIVPFTFAQAEEGALIGPKLREAVAGKTVYVHSPLGDIPVRYSPNGTMSARTELALLDGEDTSADKGRWWVEENKLCIRWQNWMERKQHCFTMHKVGHSTVRWNRDDGKSGTARLG